MTRKPFRFQYSIRALLVVMFLLGPVCGTYVYRVRQRPKDAHQAIAKLRSKGCGIEFKLQDAADMDFVSKWLGAEPMPIHCDVHADYPTFKGLSDGDMALLGTLTDFDALHLEGTKVSDSGWSHLRQVKRIGRLILDKTNITDQGIGYLSSVQGINFLTLGETSVSDRGAAMLGKRTDVEYLRLYKTNITDEGLKEIGKMKQLVDLNLDDCEITDEGIAHLHSLSELHNLSLSRTGLTDAGVAHFSTFPVESGMKSLWVTVYGCSVTIDAMRRMQERRADSAISFSGDQKE